jgi:hypothetical protein
MDRGHQASEDRGGEVAEGPGKRESADIDFDIAGKAEELQKPSALSRDSEFSGDRRASAMKRFPAFPGF